MAASGEPTTFVISQPRAPSPQLLSQNTILFNQIRKGLILLSIQPAHQRGEQHPQEDHVDHGDRVDRTVPKFGPPSW